MIDWANHPLLGYDTETTGVDTSQDRIVTAALDRHWPTLPVETRTWLVNPGVEIPAEAAAIHGITTEHATEHGQDPRDALSGITQRITAWLVRGLPLVAFNAAFDLTLTEADAHRNGIHRITEQLATLPLFPVLDPGVLDKYADPYRPGSRTLVATCAEYDVPLEDAHAAEADARAAVLLTRAVMARHHDLFAPFTLAGLHHAQTKWRQVQVKSLQQHHRREGKAYGSYDYGWPIHTNLGPDLIQAAEQGVLL